MSSRVCHGVCGCEVSRGLEVCTYARYSIVESPWSDSVKDLKAGPHRHCIQRHSYESYESAMMMNRKNACRSVSGIRGTDPMFRNFFSHNLRPGLRSGAERISGALRDTNPRRHPSRLPRWHPTISSCSRTPRWTAACALSVLRVRSIRYSLGSCWACPF